MFLELANRRFEVVEPRLVSLPPSLLFYLYMCRLLTFYLFRERCVARTYFSSSKNRIRAISSSTMFVVLISLVISFIPRLTPSRLNLLSLKILG